MRTEYRRSKAAFINPYTFVPAPRNQKVKREALGGGGSERLRTGVLRCRLFVKTPLGIPDGEMVRKTNIEGHLEYPFFSYREDGNRIPAIPGSSIRGPLRSVFEAATDSCFSTLRDNTGHTSRGFSDGRRTDGISTRRTGICWRQTLTEEAGGLRTGTIQDLRGCL